MTHCRTFLITGASRGIGFGLVSHILATYSQDRVIATYRDLSSCPQLAELTKTHSEDRLQIFPLEVSSEESHLKLKEAVEAAGVTAIDILIANAGVIGTNYGSAVTTTATDYEDIWKINLLGSLYTLQTFHEHVLRSQVKVAVVVSSILGSFTLVPNTSGFVGVVSAYRVSKAALNMLAATYAEDTNFKTAGGKVIILHPGWVRTELGGARAAITVAESVGGIIF